MSWKAGNVALATLFVALLVWYLVYTQRVVQLMREDAETMAKIYDQVQTGLTTAQDDVSGLEAALFELQGIVLESDVPIVVTVPRRGPPLGDSVDIMGNLPFENEIDLDTGL